MCEISDWWCDVRFQLVSFTAQNLVSRGLPIFESFCKPLRNVVTETFAEPAANWEVSSNRILTGRPSGSFINVKLVIHYLMLLNFRQFCKPLRNFVTKTFESCSQRVPITGVCRGVWLFWLMTLLLTRLTLWLLSEKFLWKSLTFLSYIR